MSTSTPVSKRSSVRSISSATSSRFNILSPSSVKSPQLSNRRTAPSIYEKNLSRRTPEISLSAFTFLYCEMISFMHSKSQGVPDLENRLNMLGYQVGQKTLELINLREGKTAKRPLRIIEVLQFVHTTIWKTLFGKTADALEKSQDNENEYMIIDKEPVIDQFISIPREYSSLCCSAFMAGIIESILDCSSFPADVTAHSVAQDSYPLNTVFLIKFNSDVIEREKLRFGR